MDKTFALLIITFFFLCASMVTLVSYKDFKRKGIDAFLACGYTVFVWLCVAVMTFITMVY